MWDCQIKAPFNHHKSICHYCLQCLERLYAFYTEMYNPPIVDISESADSPLAIATCMDSSNHKGLHSCKVPYAQKDMKTRQEWPCGATPSLELSPDNSIRCQNKLAKRYGNWNSVMSSENCTKFGIFLNEKQKMWKRQESCAFIVLHFTLQILYFSGWRLVAALCWGSLLSKLFQQFASWLCVTFW